MNKPRVTRTNHLLPFNELSPVQFERLCLWLVRRTGYLHAEHLGAAGCEQGRDIIAYKPTPNREQLWYFQCKLYQSIGAQTLIEEVDKCRALVVTDPSKRPFGIVFVTNARLSAQAREKVRNHCQEYGYECEFWAHTELDESVKRYADLVEEFFDEVPKETFSTLHHLPSPPRDFTGRGAELDQLFDKIHSGVTILGLHGMGGVGKTVIALKLAERIKDQYPDAQFFLDLKGLSDQWVTSTQAMKYVIHAFHRGVKLPESEDELLPIYFSVLDGKRVLIVWDNIRDVTQIAKLIPPPSCLMIVTSRERFVLPGGHSIAVNALSSKEANKLLLTISPRIGESVSPLADLCGYLPLALRLTASLLAIRSYLRLADYLHSLEDEKNRLARIDRYAPTDGVEVALSLSYRLLLPELQQRWRMLAAFPATFDTSAGATMWGLGIEVAQDVLGDLYAYSLVEWDEITERWHLHDLARIFAKRCLSEAERLEASKRQAIHYKTVLGRAKDLYVKGGESVTTGLSLVDQEWGNIRVGQAWAESQIEEDIEAAELCIEYPENGAYVLELRLHPREHIHWLELQVTAARQLNRRYSEGFALGGIGLAHARLGEPKKAIEFYQQRLIIAREIDDRRGESSMLGNLGIEYKNLGETEKAIEFYEQALMIDREISDRHGEGTDLGNLGFAYARLGNTQKAIEYYEQALIINREVGNRRSEGNVLGNLGLAYSDLGESQKAIEYYNQRLAIAREMRDQRGEGNGLFNLAMALYKIGDCAKAVSSAEESLRILEEIESPYASTVRHQLAQWRG